MSTITKFEQRSRKEIMTAEGTEVIRKFYLEPYQAHPYVLSALLGGVDSGNDGYVRRRPAADTYYPWCFCTNAEVEVLDDRVFANSGTLGYEGNAGTSPSSSLVIALQTKELIEPAAGTPEAYTQQTAKGCWITARFRPLVRVDGYVQNGSEFNKMVSDGSGQTVDAFDYLDPLLTPLQKFVSIPRGLYMVMGGNPVVKVAEEAQQSQSFGIFTIRRYLVPKIPSQTIAKLQGKVNQYDMTFGDYRFPPETLRFRGCEPRKIIITNIDGSQNIFYDLLYTFDVCLTYDLVDVGTGNFVSYAPAYAPDYVGWNRILCTSTISFGGLTGEKYLLAYYRVGTRDSAWQMNPVANAKMQFPLADGKDVIADGSGFMALFNWTAT